MLCTYPLGKCMRTVCAMCCAIDSQIIWVHHVIHPMSDDVGWSYCTSPDQYKHAHVQHTSPVHTTHHSSTAVQYYNTPVQIKIPVHYIQHTGLIHQSSTYNTPFQCTSPVHTTYQSYVLDLCVMRERTGLVYCMCFWKWRCPGHCHPLTCFK